MDISLDRFRDVVRSVRGPGELLEPPVVVLRVVAALIGDSEVQHAVSAKVAGSEGEGEGPLTSWRYVALIKVGLVAVDVTNTISDWELDGSRRTEPSPTIDARLIPIAEVTDCRVLEVQGRSLDPQDFTVRWQIGIRTGEPVRIPVGRYQAETEAASAFGRAVIDRLEALSA
ncbi:hypothetical protein [Kribbella sp. NPDC006257]|uniref:hypothetical protein n=1 Tax=Kribbella sp. NPDC006257 TaxID=3156738 RepID=UPI0033AC10D5